MNRVTKVVAHYLPQFHRVSENSQWWGPGFTEWTNSSKARPLFQDHYQPHIPADLGFYDLENIGVIAEQAELAKNYGVDAFNFYFYWFDGRRILEKPLENFRISNIEIEYCLTWANENWTRRWDGGNAEILLKQSYAPKFEADLFADLLPFFEDPRYLRLDGLPVLNIYRLQEIPESRKFVARLKDLAKQSGFDGLHVVAVASFGLDRADTVGADALMEFPPHGLTGATIVSEMPPGLLSEFSGQIMDYSTVVLESCQKSSLGSNFYRGLCPSWDNTPRRGLQAHLMHGSSPEKFGAWMQYCLEWSNLSDSPFVFINAWNEWGEGAHLEPDLKHGKSYLEQVRIAKEKLRSGKTGGLMNVLEVFDSFPTHLREQEFSPRSEPSPVGKLFSRSNFRVLFRLLRADPTLRTLTKAFIEAMVLRINHHRPRLDELSNRVPLRSFSDDSAQSKPKIAVVVHLHYLDYIAQASRLLQLFPTNTKFYFTSSSNEILAAIQKSPDWDSNIADVLLFPNRGRNFGPLFAGLGKELLNYDLLFHLHSKRSSHAGEIGNQWGAALWESLASSRNRILSLIYTFEQDKDIGLVYPDNLMFLKPESLGWYQNRNQAREWLELKGIEWSESPIFFPAGGMFACRTEAIEQLLSHNWDATDFPLEMGQVDGELQHVLERLMGVVSHANGFKHLTVTPNNLTYGKSVPPVRRRIR